MNKIKIESLLTLVNKKKIAQNFGNAFFYMGGTVVQFLISIFTLPIYSRYLSPVDFAILGYYTAINAFFFPLFDLSMSSYYLANYYSPRTTNKNEELSYAVNILNVSNILIGVIGFFVVAAYFKTFDVQFPLYPYAIIVLLYLFFNKYRTLYLIDARIQKKGLYYFLVSASAVVFNATFSIFFVVELKAGAAGRLGGQLVSQFLIAGIVLFVWLRSKRFSFRLTFNRTKLADSFRFAWPLVLAGYSYYPIGNIDKIFLERLHNLNEFGFYNVGLIVSSYVGVFF